MCSHYKYNCVVIRASRHLYGGEGGGWQLHTILQLYRNVIIGGCSIISNWVTLRHCPTQSTTQALYGHLASLHFVPIYEIYSYV